MQLIHLQNSKGFSLVEIIVAVGLTGIVGLAAINLISLTTSVNSNAQVHQDLTRLRDELQLQMNNPTLCLNMLTNWGGNPIVMPAINTTSFTATAQPINIYRAAGHVYLNGSANTTIGRLTVNSVNLLEQSAPVPGVKTAKGQNEEWVTTAVLMISSTRLDMSGTPVTNNTFFPLNISFDVTQGSKMTSCQSSNASAGTAQPLPTCQPGQFLDLQYTTPTSTGGALGTTLASWTWVCTCIDSGANTVACP